MCSAASASSKSLSCVKLGTRARNSRVGASSAQLIAADHLDLLVDLMGHSSFSRPGILLWKPAPVIITHLGYHGCIGLEQVDFKLTDSFADLADAAAYQIERPLALDCCVLPMRRVIPAKQDITTRTELGIPENAVVV